MTKVKNFLCTKVGLIVTAVALLVGASTMNAACIIWYHQPKVPQGMEKFKKF